MKEYAQYAQTNKWPEFTIVVSVIFSPGLKHSLIVLIILCMWLIVYTIKQRSYNEHMQR